MSAGKHSVHLRLSAELHEQLRLLAHREGDQTLTAVVRRLIARAVEPERLSSETQEW